MNGLIACSIHLCMILTMGTYVILGQHVCPPGTYMDTRTGRCDNCNDICQFAVIQGTTGECRKHCPGYGEELTPTEEPHCPPGQFFDPVLSHCDYCFTICENHKIQKTTDECKQKCPEEFEKDQETIRKNVLPEEKSFKTSPWLIVVITVIGVAIIASVILLTVFHHKLPPSVQQRIPCLRRRYSIAETSPSTSDGDVSLSVEESKPEEGFTDLISTRMCSQTENHT